MMYDRAFRAMAFLLAWLIVPAGACALPALWAVRSSTATIYLFGTMHVLPKKADWFVGGISRAFADSAVLMEEADIGMRDGGAVAGIMAQAIAPDQDLWSKLPAAEAAKFRAEIAKCGLPDLVVAHFRAWFASMLPAMCALMSGTDGAAATSLSPETALAKQAKADSKSMDFFETAAQQIGYLSSAPEAVQLKELRAEIADDRNSKETFDGMEDAWLAGDVPAIAKLVESTRGKGIESYDLLFTQRNARFAARIRTLLAGTKTVFVAIGAGHLAGPDSVQAQLCRLGFAAQRIDGTQPKEGWGSGACPPRPPVIH